MVERFSPCLHSFDAKLEIEKLDRELPSADGTSTFGDVFELYGRFKSRLSLTQLSAREVEALDQGFLEFAAARDRMQASLRNEQNGDALAAEVSGRIGSDAVVALWVAHDFALPRGAPALLRCVGAVFETRRSSLSVGEPDEVVAWAATVARLHELEDAWIAGSLFGEVFPALIAAVFPSVAVSVSSKCAVLAVLRYARRAPWHFCGLVEHHGLPTKLIDVFIQVHLDMPTFVCAASDFFRLCLPSLSEASRHWYHALFYHLAVSEVCRNPLRLAAAESYLAVWKAVVDARTPESVPRCTECTSSNSCESILSSRSC